MSLKAQFQAEWSIELAIQLQPPSLIGTKGDLPVRVPIKKGMSGRPWWACSMSEAKCIASQQTKVLVNGRGGLPSMWNRRGDGEEHRTFPRSSSPRVDVAVALVRGACCNMWTRYIWRIMMMMMLCSCFSGEELHLNFYCLSWDVQTTWFPTQEISQD